MGIPLAKIQERLGLKPDGVFGKQTLIKLTEALGLTKEQSALFFGRVAVETGNFAYDEENLNYSINNLLKVFPNHFKTVESTKGYANNPIALANKVYANKDGNGNEASGDGWKFRGRGGIQTTRKRNYELFSKYIGEDCVANPDLVATKYYIESSKFYFDNNKLWQYCSKVDKDSITKISKAVNLGNALSKYTPHGLEDAIIYTTKYYTWLNQQ